jgi:hypothetical protein
LLYKCNSHHYNKIGAMISDAIARWKSEVDAVGGYTLNQVDP